MENRGIRAANNRLAARKAPMACLRHVVEMHPAQSTLVALLLRSGMALLISTTFAAVIG
jgi:hypothetical protein